MATPLLDVQNLRISFAGKSVVHGIDFSIAPGEKLALVGESGSGKTVTALSLLRLAQNAAVNGKAVFTGVDGAGRTASGAPPRSPVDLLSLPEQSLRGIRGRDIAMIFQEPMTALNPLFSVGNQIAEVIQLKQGLAQAESAQAAIKLLADTGITEPERRANSFPHQLSGGQRQRAMIAMALACQPRLLLADEPTTALDVTLRGQILDLLGDLQQRNGMAVLMITHDLNLVRKFADRVAVMENGRIVEQGPVAEVFARPQHAYTRKLIDSKPQRDGLAAADGGADRDAPAMKADKLRVAYPVPIPGIRGWFRHAEFVAVKSASFQIPPGRTLGVIGESGSGKSTLALASLGLLPFSGELQAAGQAWSRQAARNKAIRRAVQVVFQDPFSSLSPRMTVEAIVEEGLLVHEPGLAALGRRERALQALADVGMTDAQFPGLLQRYPHEFSGGQRQRLAIARALIVNPSLLVLDEPTSALDVTIQKQVLGLLQRLQRERGLSYLLITHDVDVIRAMAHEVMVMKDGDVLEAGSLSAVLDTPQHPYTRVLVSAA
ncbi:MULTISPECIES: ABC transporter ATP-binding protein [unclassified Polaromonas]|uniref:ABC transporter ATP-binding protein n=1 Tax=unclassified Polaromonas TaxID=2638319 RepID=UPI000F091712|nr:MULTISPECIES: dipeptide ABC transporter ATP-binding protein [unclassified Polaromonas]AYQ29455.1 ABC transporter ATP-binding protein [Polaromonas sp. SP1]QGJ19430.1 dipeptide ABC transporter ATP-binding protein [Polaromonas sp. Pch-P]